MSSQLEEILQAIRDLSSQTGSTLEEICGALSSRDGSTISQAQVVERINEGIDEGVIGRPLGTDRYVVLEAMPRRFLGQADIDALDVVNGFLVEKGFLDAKYAQLSKELIIGHCRGVIGKLEGMNHFILLDQNRSRSHSTPTPEQASRLRRIAASNVQTVQVSPEQTSSRSRSPLRPEEEASSRPKPSPVARKLKKKRRS